MVTAHPAIPEPALVVLVGVSGSGKSTWAAQRFRSTEIVSSDHLRAVVGQGETDRSATVDAMAVLNQIVAARARRRLTCVVDTTGLHDGQRAAFLALARSAGIAAVVVLLDTPPRVARARNAARDRRVPATVITTQLRRYAAVKAQVENEGWDQVIMVEDARTDETPLVRVPDAEPGAPDGRPEFILQLSRFPAPEVDTASWLLEMSDAAVAAGFDGLALMDHLIQIPQVGRAFDPIPDPWVTLGLLAGMEHGLRLGTLVSATGTRPAGVLAKAAANLDVLAGGRTFLGLGAGWWEREYAAVGLPFPSAPDRLDLLDRSIETIRALWSPGTKAYAGDTVSLPETTAYPRPTGRIPIIVGGGGERRTLRIAAERGDACNLSSRPEVLDRKIEVLRRHCADVGRDPAEVAITVLDVTAVGADRDEVAGHVERLHGRSTREVWARTHQVGTVEEQVRRYAGLADKHVAMIFVALPQVRRPDDLAAVAPVLAAFR